MAPTDYAPALAVAGLVEHGLLLERPDTLTPVQLDELTVWADSRQAHGQPGRPPALNELLASRLSDKTETIG